MEIFSEHFLSLQLIILLVSGLLISFAPFNERQARITALFASFLVLGLAAYQYFELMDFSKAQMQLVETYPWISDIKFSLGVDGLAYSMVLLTAILMPCTIS